MKKNRTLDKNHIVVACLFLVCVLLVVLIFSISNRTVPVTKHVSAGVTRDQVAQAYDFLNQEEAVRGVLDALEEPFTYKEYRTFLEQLNLWEAGSFEEFVDWEAQAGEPVSPDLLVQSADRVAELFETAAEQDEQAVSTVMPETVTMPQVDAQTKIRVLLLQKGAPVAQELWFSANEPYEIRWHGKKKEKKKHQVICAGQLKLSEGETAVVSSKTGEVYLADAKGARNTLGYRGTFLITRHEDGYSVVNEVPIEEYLYGVVQSEMPTYFEPEALKAQAVCARTYIVTQLMQDNYPVYNADVDDSVRYQVYNQAAPDERVVAAVDATKGQILTKDGLPIHAYFFSTSHGVTSGREIWGLPKLDYLQPVRGNADAKMPDLSDEETFRAYIRASDESDYDFTSSYYRWRATLDISEHMEEVRTLLCDIDEIQPECVIIRYKNGQETTTAALADWKEALQLKVLERSASGAVQRLLIVFSEGEAELVNENYIRQVLGIWMNVLRDKNGSAISTSNRMLPSVYFYVQPVKEGIVLFGGGLGHGIGMSQYGANALAVQGADKKEILSFYYRGAQLCELYAGVSE